MLLTWTKRILSRGGGGTPYNGLRLRPKGVPFSGLRYMKGYEVYERVGKSAIWVCERAQRAKKWILFFYKFEKTFYLCDWFLIERQQLKEMQSSKQGMWKGYHLSIEGNTKGVAISWKIVYKRVRGWTLGRSLPAWKFVEYTLDFVTVGKSHKLAECKLNCLR